MKVYRNPEVVWREEDESRAEAYAALSQGRDAGDVGTSVLLSDGVMLSLNILGTEIWKRCDGRDVDEIVSDLAKEFDAEPAVLKKDTLAFLSELSAKGFVRYDA